MKPLGRDKVRRRWLSGATVVAVVLILGGLASVGAALAVNGAQRRQATREMDQYLASVTDVIAHEVSDYDDALIDLAAGISSQYELTGTDFTAMTATLNPQRLPGAIGVNFVIPASDDEAAAAQAYWRPRSTPDLTLPRGGTAGPHKFVIFGRAFAPGATVPGRDLAKNPLAADTLRIAAETRAVTVGRAHVLLLDRDLPADRQQMSFAVAAPVYGRPGTAAERSVRGWVVSGVRGRDFLGETLRNHAGGAVQLSLTDPAAPAGAAIAEVTGGVAMTDPALVRSATVLVGQRTWRLTMRPTVDLLSATDRRMTELTLLSGGVVTVLLAGLIGALVGARARAMNRVDEATAALRKDIRRRETLEVELQRLAFHDSLTGLANRTLFYDRVGQALRGHARAEQSFAVFFLDLDGFKQVNDELGHSAGDTVLLEVAERLRACLREGDTVSRFGGDEFAVIVERLDSPDDVHLTANRIVDAVQQPIDLGRRVVTVTASVGVALNHPGYTADDILREADVAMYTAKSTGKCRHVLAGTSTDHSPADGTDRYTMVPIQPE